MKKKKKKIKYKSYYILLIEHKKWDNRFVFGMKGDQSKYEWIFGPKSKHEIDNHSFGYIKKNNDKKFARIEIKNS